MKNFEIITDSCCDLEAGMAEELGLHVVPLSMHVGEKAYKNYLDGREISFENVYKILRSEQKASTSAPNVQDFGETLTPLLENGRDVLILSFSSGLSATYGSAKIAAEDAAEKYPDRKIYVVDTLCASLGQGLLVYTCAKLADEGKSIEEVRDFAENHKLNVCHWFTIDSFLRLKLGGRVSNATAFVGTLIGIKPVLHVDDDGKLINMSKVRGREKAIDALAKKLQEGIKNPEQQTIFISHGDCIQDAEKLAKKIKELVPVKDFVISYVGPVIGSHSGAGTLALFWFGDKR